MREPGYNEDINLRCVASSVVITLVAYYTILFFHWSHLQQALRKPGSQIFAMVAIGILPSLLKGGLALRFYRKMNRTVFAIKAIAMATYYIVFLLGCILGAVWATRAFRHVRALGDYWQRYHLLWTLVLIALLFGYVGIVLARFQLLRWRFYKDLQAIPLFSPVLCFGGPFFGIDKFNDLGMSSTQTRIYAAVLIAAGIVFLVSLIWYALWNAHFSRVSDSPIKDRKTQKRSPISEHAAAQLGIAGLGLGLALVLWVAVDLGAALLNLGHTA
jgi:hypothetical protein